MEKMSVPDHERSAFRPIGTENAGTQRAFRFTFRRGTQQNQGIPGDAKRWERAFRNATGTVFWNAVLGVFRTRGGFMASHNRGGASDHRVKMADDCSRR